MSSFKRLGREEEEEEVEVVVVGSSGERGFGCFDGGFLCIEAALGEDIILCAAKRASAKFHGK